VQRGALYAEDFLAHFASVVVARRVLQSRRLRALRTLSPPVQRAGNERRGWRSSPLFPVSPANLECGILIE